MNESPELGVRPVRAGDWTLIEALFGERGACGGCWCMEWRRPGTRAELSRHKGESNRQALKSLLEAGQGHGCIALAGDRPVGWCSVGPRADFPRLLASRALASGASADTWAVTCFYVDRRWRGRRVATRLLDAAVELARHAGARQIEGYPASPPRAGGPLPAAFACRRRRCAHSGRSARPRPVGRRRRGSLSTNGVSGCGTVLMCIGRSLIVPVSQSTFVPTMPSW